MNEQGINEKIHVEIMGEKCFHDWSDNDEDLLWRCSKCPNAVLHKTELPNYCQNISDAFLVVGKLQNEGYAVDMKAHDSSRWGVEFYGTGNYDIESEDKSLPKAICLAALKTLESK